MTNVNSKFYVQIKSDDGEWVNYRLPLAEADWYTGWISGARHRAVKVQAEQPDREVRVVCWDRGRIFIYDVYKPSTMWLQRGPGGIGGQSVN